MSGEVDVILRGRKFKRMVEHIFEDIRKKYDLRQIEIELLFYLSEEPNASASDIYRNLNLNKGQVSQALDHLCRNGYLQSRIDPADRRYVSYEMLEKASVIIEEGIVIRDSMQSLLFAGLTEEELKVMEHLTEKISLNIDRIVEKCGGVSETGHQTD